MTKGFAINFYFNQKCYSALVNLQSHKYDMAFVVDYMDNDVKQIIPGGHLVFSLSEGLKQPHHLSNESATDFVCCTAEAIANYLQLQEN